MRIVELVQHGKSDYLRIKEVEKLSPGDNEVLIKIVATSVTSGDVALRKQTLLQFLLLWPISRLVFGIRNQRKKVLGHEFSGIIEEIGKNVKDFKVGDSVLGTTGFQGGAYAEYICINEHKTIIKKTEALSFNEAATLPIGGICALYFLQKSGISKANKVLVYGASGSIGTYAIQISKYYDTEVTGVCSASNIELVSSLGADNVIDYKKDEINGFNENFDIIFDTVGKISKSKVKNILSKDGKFISTHSSPVKEKPEHLVILVDMVKTGKIQSIIDKTFSLEEICKAHEYVETGRKKGNVVIEVKPTHNNVYNS